MVEVTFVHGNDFAVCTITFAANLPFKYVRRVIGKPDDVLSVIVGVLPVETIEWKPF